MIDYATLSHEVNCKICLHHGMLNITTNNIPLDLCNTQNDDRFFFPSVFGFLSVEWSSASFVRSRTYEIPRGIHSNIKRKNQRSRGPSKHISAFIITKQLTDSRVTSKKELSASFEKSLSPPCEWTSLFVASTYSAVLSNPALRMSWAMVFHFSIFNLVFLLLPSRHMNSSNDRGTLTFPEKECER